MNARLTPFNPPAQFWAHSWASIAQLIVNGLLKSILVIASYYSVKAVSTGMRSGQMINPSLLLILLSIAMLMVVLRVHERYTSEKMSQRYINRIRSGLLKRIMRASVRTIQNKTIGNLSSRLAGDLSAIKRWLSLGISRLVTHSLLLMITTLLIFNINFSLGIYITLTLFSLIFASALVGHYLKNSIRNVRKNRIKIHSLLVERLSLMTTIRAMGKEQQEVRKINKQAKRLENNVSKQGIFLGILRGIGDASSLVLIAVFFGFHHFNQNALSLDEMTALISIILFLNAPIRELGRIQEYYQGANLSLNKLQELYAIPRIIRGKSALQKATDNNGTVYIKHLKLAGVFNHLNLQAKTGEHIAITGKNGAGKSTLIQLLLGLIKADSGTVRVNGLRPQLSMPSDRSTHIGVCGANIRIIKTTLKNNLTYRIKTYQQGDFDALLDYCQLHELINKLPHGLDTKVTENGNNFSSGEKARISLFRALLGHPSLLILDEPENYLDSVGLSLIKSLLSTYAGTVLIATHHSALIALCDKQWNLNKNTTFNKSNPHLTVLHDNEI